MAEGDSFLSSFIGSEIIQGFFVKLTGVFHADTGKTESFFNIKIQSARSAAVVDQTAVRLGSKNGKKVVQYILGSRFIAVVIKGIFAVLLDKISLNMQCFVVHEKSPLH